MLPKSPYRVEVTGNVLSITPLQSWQLQKIRCVGSGKIQIIREVDLGSFQQWALITLDSTGAVAARLRQRISWESAQVDPNECVVILTASRPSAIATDVMTKLYRTICSCIQDYKRYPTFETTPSIIFKIWDRSHPGRKHAINRFFLDIQLRVIYYQNDHLPCQGIIPFALLSESNWATQMENESIMWISWFVVAICYFV